MGHLRGENRKILQKFLIWSIFGTVLPQFLKFGDFPGQFSDIPEKWDKIPKNGASERYAPHIRFAYAVSPSGETAGTRGGIHNATSGLRSGFHICRLTVSSILIGEEAWKVTFPDATFPSCGTMNTGSAVLHLYAGYHKILP